MTETKRDELLPIWRIVKMPASAKSPKAEPILPIGRATFQNGVKAGIYPQPVQISKRRIAWRASEIYALIDSGILSPGNKEGA